MGEGVSSLDSTLAASAGDELAGDRCTPIAGETHRTRSAHAPLHIIKCYDGGAEEDEWNRFLLEPLGIVEHVSPDFSIVEDRALYFVNGTRGLAHMPASFLARVQKLNCKGLYHLGDEFLAGGYDIYRHFDFVVRNHYAGALDHAGIRTIALGYPCGMAGGEGEMKASARPLVWSFLGNLMASRAQMIEEFRGLAPHHLHVYQMRREGNPKVSREEYKKVLRASTFVPCPMGNVMLETFRVYEALEAGAIPLLSRRARMPYHDLVMPGHPLPAFADWSSARDFAARLLAEPAELDAVQRRIAAWWSAYKANLRATLCDFVERGFRGEFRAELRERWRPPAGIAWQAWRAAELLRHHDAVAIKGRAEIMLGRLARRAGLLRARA